MSKKLQNQRRTWEVTKNKRRLIHPTTLIDKDVDPKKLLLDGFLSSEQLGDETSLIQVVSDHGKDK